MDINSPCVFHMLYVCIYIIYKNLYYNIYCYIWTYLQNKTFYMCIYLWIGTENNMKMKIIIWSIDLGIYTIYIIYILYDIVNRKPITRWFQHFKIFFLLLVMRWSHLLLSTWSQCTLLTGIKFLWHQILKLMSYIFKRSIVFR